MSPQKFGGSTASNRMPDDYYSQHNIWHVAFSEQLDPLCIEFSSKQLRSDTETIGLYEDEGGPLSYEPDQLAQLYIETIQSLIPDGMLVSCRVFEGIRGFFERSVFGFPHIGADIQRLAQVFTRFGVDPDSIADYIFVSADPMAHEAATLQTIATSMDKFLNSTHGQKQQAEPRRKFLADMTRIYEPLIWAEDGFLFVATHHQGKDEIKNKLAPIAAKYNLELPRHDFILRGW